MWLLYPANHSERTHFACALVICGHKWFLLAEYFAQFLFQQFKILGFVYTDVCHFVLIDTENWVVVVGRGLFDEQQGWANIVFRRIKLARIVDDERIEKCL